MKSIALVMMLFLVHSYSFSQETSLRSKEGENVSRIEQSSSNNSNPQSTTAQLSKENINGSYKYTFVSPKLLSASKVDQWEDRFKTRFSIIEDISMNASDQSIEIILPNTHTEEQLLEILKRFDFVDFEIEN